jgi:hypothetical protein
MGDQQSDGEPEARARGLVTPRPIPLFEWAERFAKIAAVLVVFGYISLRVHWNHHGIPSMTWLGVDTYLVEVYGIVSSFLLHPLLVLVAVLAICAVTVAVWAHRLSCRSAWVRRTEDRLVGKVVPWFSSLPGAAAALLLALLFLGLVGWSLVPSFRWSESDLAMGQLDASRLAARNRCMPEHGWFTFWLIGVVTLVGYAAYVRLSPYADSQGSPAACFGTRCLWRAFAVTLLALVLWLPFVYGVGIHTPEYRAAQVHMKPEGKSPEGDSLLGLIVLDTPAQVELWSARDGVGSVVILPRDQIQSMKIGAVWDLRQVALQAARPPKGAWPRPEMLAGPSPDQQ